MDKSDCCSASYSLEKWSAFLKQKQNKMILFLKQIENKSKIFLEQNGNVLTIKIPKMLEYKDNYSKDLEVAPKKLPSKEVDIDTDKEKNKKTSTNIKKGRKKQDSVLGPSELEQFERWYKSYPKKVSRIEAEQEWKVLNPDAELVECMIKILHNQIANGSFSEDKKYILHPSRWIKRKRWIDEDSQPLSSESLNTCKSCGKYYPSTLSKCPQCP